MLDCSSALTWTATPFWISLSETFASPGRDGVEVLAAVELAGDRAVAAAAAGRDRDGADIALVDLADELGIGDRLARRGARAAVDHLHEEDEREQHAGPDQQALGPGVAGLLVFVVHRSSFGAKTPALKIGASAPITMRALGTGERPSRNEAAEVGKVSSSDVRAHPVCRLFRLRRNLTLRDHAPAWSTEGPL